MHLSKKEQVHRECNHDLSEHHTSANEWDDADDITGHGAIYERLQFIGYALLCRFKPSTDIRGESQACGLVVNWAKATETIVQIYSEINLTKFNCL